MRVIHKEEYRGGAHYGWLKTRYSFSFADWYEESRMGFGALLVLNDDWIKEKSGFPMHAHRDMEIITIVTGGAVTHKDSMGNSQTVPVGDVQVMSAGTGVRHSEENISENTPLSLFQIWIRPRTFGITPRYNQKSFQGIKEKEGLSILVNPDTDDCGGLAIHQDAYIFYGFLKAGGRVSYSLKNEGHGVYVFVVAGEVSISKDTLSSRDAMGITDEKEITFVSGSGSEFLVIEIPMNY